MNLNCAREFKLTVGSDLTRSYYPCETHELDGAFYYLRDVINGRDMRMSDIYAGEPAFITGAVNNGLRMATTVGGSPSWITGDADDFWNSSLSSFTCRFWFRANFLPLRNAILVLGTDQWKVYSYDAFTHSELGFDLYWESGSPSATDFYITIADENWHRVVFWWEKGVGYGYQFDNNAPTTVARTDDLDHTSPNRALDMRGRSSNCIDEIGFWQRKLTTEELLYDWNDGNGRTYPDIP